MPTVFTCILLAASSERIGRLATESMIIFTALSYIFWNFSIDEVCRVAYARGYVTYNAQLLVAVGFTAMATTIWGSLMGCLLIAYAAHRAGARRVSGNVAGLPSSIPSLIAAAAVVFTGTTILVAVPYWTSLGMNGVSVGTRHLLVYVGYIVAIVVIGLAVCAVILIHRSLVAARASAIELYTAAENMEHAAALGNRGYAGV